MAPPPPVFVCKPFDRPIAALFASSPFARDLFAQGAGRAAIAEAKSLLGKVFGADVLKEIATARATGWVSDPYALKRWPSSFPGGGGEARAELARPIDDKVFFAGEAASPDGFSTCTAPITAASPPPRSSPTRS